MAALSMSQFWSSLDSLAAPSAPLSEPSGGFFDDPWKSISEVFSPNSSEQDYNQRAGYALSSPSGASPANQGEDSEIFCPLLLVNEPGGITLTVGGLITSKPQQEIFDVKRELSGSDNLLLTAYVSEGDRMSDGILFESPLGLQVAFLDTSRAFLEEPLISIIRPEQESLEKRPRTAYASSDMRKSAWAVATKEGPGLVHIRRAKGRGPVMMTVRHNSASDSANLTDPRGRLLATMNTRRNQAGKVIMVIQIGGGDAGLLLCCLVAALKMAQ